MQLHDVQLLALLQFRSITSSVRLARNNTRRLRYKGCRASHQHGHFATYKATPAAIKAPLPTPNFCPSQQTALITDLSHDVIVLPYKACNARTRT
jgi:hypothetical protein